MRSQMLHTNCRWKHVTVVHKIFPQLWLPNTFSVTGKFNAHRSKQIKPSGIWKLEHLESMKTNKKIASEMPVPHSLGKYFQHHEIQKHCTSTKFRILSELCQLYKVPKNV